MELVSLARILLRDDVDRVNKPKVHLEKFSIHERLTRELDLSILVALKSEWQDLAVVIYGRLFLNSNYRLSDNVRLSTRRALDSIFFEEFVTSEINVVDLVSGPVDFTKQVKAALLYALDIDTNNEK